jgi:hypothetical protein
MSESLRKKIVFATLPLAILWAWFNYPSAKKAPAAQFSDQLAVPAATVVAAPDPGRPQIDIEQKAQEGWGQDPFRCYTYRAARSTTENRVSTRLEWVLGGIVYSHSNPFALINKKAVKIGDRVGRATVVRIEKESVTLEYQGRQITLKLNKG